VRDGFDILLWTICIFIAFSGVVKSEMRILSLHYVSKVPRGPRQIYRHSRDSPPPSDNVVTFFDISPFFPPFLSSFLLFPLLS